MVMMVLVMKMVMMMIRMTYVLLSEIRMLMVMMVLVMMMIITGATHRDQPLRYILGGAEPHPPWVPVPKATHILRGQVPKYCCFVGTAPGQSSVSVTVSVCASVSV